MTMQQALIKTMNLTSCVVCHQGPIFFDSKVALYAGREVELLGCGSCHSYYLAPTISHQDIEKCYMPTYHKPFSATLKKNFIKGVLFGRYLRRRKNKGRFLDIGCALGGFVAGVAHGSGWESYGIEITDTAVVSGKQLFPNVQFFKGEIRDLPLTIPCFDMIFVNNVLEHVSDPEKFLTDVFSRLRPGGLMKLIVPNGPVDISPNRRLYQDNKNILLTKHGGHLFFLSREGLRSLFSRTGFKVVSWKTFHFIPALKALGYFPGKIKKFHKKHVPHQSLQSYTAPTNENSLFDITFKAPSSWSIGLSRIFDVIRYPFRYGFGLGYDFEIILQKPE